MVNPPDAALLLRSARMLDWPSLRALQRTLFPHIGDAEASHLLRQYHDAAVVACRSGKVIGYYQFHAHAEPGVAWLNHFGVRPEDQGSGVADALFTFLLRQTKPCGFHTIALDAFADNLRAHRFYERRGFQRISMQVHDGRMVVRFRLPLGDVAPLEHTVPALRPAGFLKRAIRALTYRALVARR